ncbi:MAG: hypothetical protein RLZZ342_436 [Candidatus Parcubacteria bacterium]
MAVILLTESSLYYVVYRSHIGRAAVYRSPYAWILDVLAIISGVSVAGAALFFLSDDSLLRAELSPLIFWWFFIIGSSQALMHIIKWGIRATQRT